MSDIVTSGSMAAPTRGLNFLSNWLPLFPIFIIYFISGLAETNRHRSTWWKVNRNRRRPHDRNTRACRFAMFFLAEYANMILISALAAIMFSATGRRWLPAVFIPGWIWLGIKTFCVVTMFLWVRSFPRYRYDQIMRLGWKAFIPVTLVWRWWWASGCRPWFQHLEALRSSMSADDPSQGRVEPDVGAAKGLKLTRRHLFRREDHHPVHPEEKTPLSPRFRGLHANALARTAKSAASPASCARGGLPGAGHHHRVDARDGNAPHHARYDIDLTKCIFCGFCEEACPVDAIVETHHFEYHGEKRGDLYFTKDMLLCRRSLRGQLIKADRTAEVG